MDVSKEYIEKRFTKLEEHVGVALVSIRRLSEQTKDLVNRLERVEDVFKRLANAVNENEED